MITIDIIKKYIDEWDPIGLFNYYCPSDEYESEIHDIFHIINDRVLDDITLGRIIFDVLCKLFYLITPRSLKNHYKNKYIEITKKA